MKRRLKLTSDFNYVDIIDIYKLSSFNTSYGYNIRFNNKHRLVFNQIGFQYTDYEIRPAFDSIIIGNPLQQRSFQTTFFTGLAFRDLSYFYQSDNGLLRQ